MPVQLQRPGVYATEHFSASPQVVAGAGGFSVATFVGPTPRGPATPTLVSSWSEFSQLFGGLDLDTTGNPAAVALAVLQYFANGGGQCYVSRVVSSSATAATLVLVDRASSPALNTLTLTAISPGAWGHQMYVRVTDQDVANGRFNLEVFYGGNTNDKIVERFTDLVMTPGDPRYVVTILNNRNVGSKFFTIADDGSATAAPDNVPEDGTFQFGSSSDGSSLSTGDWSNGVDALDVVPSPMVINMPGNVDTTQISNLLSYCEDRADCFAVVDCDSSLDVADVESFANTFTSSYGAVYYPQLYIPDPVSSLPGSTRLVPPGGAVLGRYSVVDTQRGPFKTPAGYGYGLLAGVAGVEVQLTPANLDSLNVHNVNAIRLLPANGPTIMGGRTFQIATPANQIAIRRSMIYIRRSCVDLTEFAVFETNEPTLWTRVSDTLNGFLTQYWQAGGLQGNSASEAFYVVCDESNNTPTTIAAGELHVDVGVALVNAAEYILISISQWNGTTTVQTV